MKNQAETIETLKLAHYKEAEKTFKEAKKKLDELKDWVMENVSQGSHGPWVMLIKETSVSAYEVKAHVRKQLIVEESRK